VLQAAQKAGQAGALLFFRKVLAGILNIVVIAYLAHILDKEDFGLISIATVFTELLNITWLCVGDYLVYKNKKAETDIIGAVFWLNAFLIILIISILVFIAPYISMYYHNEKIKYIIYILSVGYTGIILSNVPQALLKSNLDFKPILISLTITGILSQLSQLALASMGFGVYSMAIPGAVFPIVSGIYLFVKVKPAIGFNLQLRRWKEIITYTRFIIASKVLGRVATDGDSIIISKTLGLGTLGIYNIAGRFSNFINQSTMPILEDISLPLFVKYNDNNNIVRKQFVYIIRLTSLLLTPFYCIIILFAPLIIHILCGDKWMDAVLPLRILCIFSIFESVIYATGAIYNALGKPEIKFQFALLYTPVFLILVWFFSYKGLVTTCIIITVLRMINFTYNIYRAGKMIDLSLYSFIKEIKHIIIPNIIMSIVCIMMIYTLHNNIVVYLMLIVYVPAIIAITYTFYRKNIIQDYLLFTKVFPAFK